MARSMKNQEHIDPDLIEYHLKMTVTPTGTKIYTRVTTGQKLNLKYLLGSHHQAGQTV